jgi:hypothetical protein
MRLHKAWVIGLALLGLVQVDAQAEAAERGFYVGAGVGHGDTEGVHLEQINMDGSVVSGSTDDAHRAWKVFAGTDQFALWGEWQRFPEISELDSEIFWGGLRVGF